MLRRDCADPVAMEVTVGPQARDLPEALVAMPVQGSTMHRAPAVWMCGPSACLMMEIPLDL
jgi:hypothetical protein